ncbi:DUF4062 domain-containing protein [Nocardioides sp. WV_118_6]
MRVLISSTGTDLADYRRIAVEVCEDFGHEAVFMENKRQFPPQRASPEQVCRDFVHTCDVVVVLVGYRYGTLLPDRDVSYTELEFDTAIGIDHVDVQAWIMREDHPWPQTLCDSGEQLERVLRFRERLASSHVSAHFGDPGKFRRDLGIVLDEIRARRGASPTRAHTSGDQSDAARAPEPVAHPDYIGSLAFTGRSSELGWLTEWARSAAPVAVVDAIGGTGKSALTWTWWTTRAPTELPHLVGRFWWSFYEHGNTMTAFFRAFLDYAGVDAGHDEDHATLGRRVLHELSTRQHLVVLDGVERLLDAYADLDGSSVADGAVDRLAPEAARRVADARDHRFLQQLVGVRASKLLMSTRLVPDALVSFGAEPRAGVRLLTLGGLSDEDLRQLLERLGVRGADVALEFFSYLGNHPLLVKIVLGLVGNHRAAPGDFAAWRSDATAGGAFRLDQLTLTERSAHILANALDSLDPHELTLLQRLAVPYGSSEWDLVRTAFNPYADPSSLGLDGMPPWLRDHLLGQAAVIESATAVRQLDAALRRLEDRGLVWWDRSGNLYDMHPVVRAHVRDGSSVDDQRRTHRLVVDHFGYEHRDDVAPDEMYGDQWVLLFRSLVGAGMAQEAVGFWVASKASSRLLWTDGANRMVVALLAPLIELVEARGAWTGIVRDLGIAEHWCGLLDRALDRHFRILKHVVSQRKSLETVLITMLDAHISAGEAGRSALSGALRSRWVRLAQVDGAPDERARLELIRAMRLLAEEQYDQVGPLVTRVLSEHALDDDVVLADLEETRLEALAELGQWAEIPPLRPRDVPYGSSRLASLWKVRLDWAELCVRLSQLRGSPEDMLKAAREIDLLRRRGGQESLRADEALALAQLGRFDEARALVELAVSGLPRLPWAMRPFEHLARCYVLLDDGPTARLHALEHYRVVWADGPPSHSRRQVRKARDLLDELDCPVPELPSVDPATLSFPHQDELDAYIDAARRGETPHL